MKIPGVGTYVSGFLEPREACELFCFLREEVTWRKECIRLFGHFRQVPRLVSWCGDEGLSYRYSGKDHTATGWPEALESLRTRIGPLLGEVPNFLLMNLYRHGDDSMGWHRDDERGLNPLIASVSLGARRRFLLREEGARSNCPLTLDDGSLLLFDGRLRHTLPKTRRPVGERINLTFRVLE